MDERVTQAFRDGRLLGVFIGAAIVIALFAIAYLLSMLHLTPPTPTH